VVSEWFILIVWGKMGVEIWGQWISSLLIFSFVICLIKIISPKNFLVSSGVILDYFSVLGETFIFVHFDYG
jgi:hypothetical protein